MWARAAWAAFTVATLYSLPIDADSKGIGRSQIDEREYPAGSFMKDVLTGDFNLNEQPYLACPDIDYPALNRWRCKRVAAGAFPRLNQAVPDLRLLGICTSNYRADLLAHLSPNGKAVDNPYALAGIANSPMNMRVIDRCIRVSQLQFNNREDWRVSCGERLFRDKCGILGGFCSISGDRNRFLHIASLDGGGTPSMLSLLLASAVEEDRSNPKSDSRNSQDEREERYRVARRPLPESFALFCLVMSLLSGIVTFLLLTIGRSIGRLPAEYPRPKHSSDQESEYDLGPQPSPTSDQKSLHQ
jgi:hypothetical protein